MFHKHLGKKTYTLSLGGVPISSHWLIMFMSSIFFFAIFCLVILFIIYSRVLKSPNIIVKMFLSTFSSLSWHSGCWYIWCPHTGLWSSIHYFFFSFFFFLFLRWVSVNWSFLRFANIFFCLEESAVDCLYWVCHFSYFSFQLRDSFIPFYYLYLW